MTDIDVSRAAVERVLDGVTAPLWNADGYRVEAFRGTDSDGAADYWEAVAECENEADARFIAWCREGVPALLARAEAAEAERDRYFNGGARYLQDYADTLVQLASAQSRAEAAETALAAERETVARLTEALTLAANRLHRRAVDFDTGSRAFIETSEWAEEARAALTQKDRTDGE